MHDDSDDEIAKKRRLPPSSAHQLVAEQHAQDRLDQLHRQEIDRLRMHQPNYTRLQQGSQAELRRRAEQEASHYLEVRQQQRATAQTVEVGRDSLSEQQQTSPELTHQQERMTPEQRSRHDAFAQDPLIDQRAALQAARVIRHEYDKRRAPELGAIRTRRANNESDREHRMSEGRPLQQHGQSRTAQDAEAISRRQDQQKKDADRQENLREQGSEAPAEKLQELKIARTELASHSSWSDRYETTREERKEVERSQAHQQARGLTRGR
jgi:hypothetical protein